MPATSEETEKLLRSLKPRRTDVAVDPYIVPSIRVPDPVGDILRRSEFRRATDSENDGSSKPVRSRKAA